ncbi:glycosyltransferase family 2 protein [Pedobacter agri]|uniref:glycosyltransferase family 2 protein n=1 Tax=Pedobacter agri TaxID=454586 RepID=UPI00292D67EC|nr:glycosyltransferase family 2 protein [Pedobacter agri]
MLKKEISIIIATYNSEKYLEQAILSVLNQGIQNYELIIIDAASTDLTVDIIEKYKDNISYWVSEPDKGIYDAWNKGLKHTTGEWVMFIGSDDYLLQDALAKYSNFIRNIDSDVDYISARNQMIDSKGKEIRVKGWQWEWPLFLSEMTVSHPASLHRRRLFDQYGFFDTNYKIVGDYEFLLRPKDLLKASYMNEIILVMREGGASDSIKAIYEHNLAAVNTGGENVFKAIFSFIITSVKVITKRILRSLGFNAYLKK